MEVSELVIEVALRALVYGMEADLGMEKAMLDERYQKMEKRLADLEAKHIAEASELLGLGGGR